MKAFKIFLLVNFISLFSFCANADGTLLIYNQFPRSYGMDLSKMKDDLERISKMGFNCVWINPIQKASDTAIVRRFNRPTA